MNNSRNDERMTIGEAWNFLQFLSADDRGLWVKIGGVFKDEFGDEGFSLWDEWSQCSDKYSARDAAAVWRSLGKNTKRAGIASLVYLAKARGWTPDAEVPKVLPAQKPAPTTARDTSAYASRLWLSARFDDAVVGAHPYAVKKGITWAAGAKRGTASGSRIGKDADCVIVPIRADAVGLVQGVQCINSEGKKQTFGKVHGGCLVIGNTLDVGIPWYVAEGWASAVSVVFHHHHGSAVCAAAFGKHNLRAAAEILERVFNPPEIEILREQD